MVLTAARREKIKKITVDVLLIVTISVFLLATFGKYRPELIMSNSMYPLLKAGNVVLAQKVSTDDVISTGDIYTYRIPGANYTITHRCIEVIDTDGTERYVFKGDNNEKQDEKPVEKTWIEYKLIKY